MEITPERIEVESKYYYIHGGDLMDMFKVNDRYFGFSCSGSTELFIDIQPSVVTTVKVQRGFFVGMGAYIILNHKPKTFVQIRGLNYL